jgi:hypothetical protein
MIRIYRFTIYRFTAQRYKKNVEVTKQRRKDTFGKEIDRKDGQMF